MLLPNARIASKSCDGSARDVELDRSTALANDDNNVSPTLRSENSHSRFKRMKIKTTLGSLADGGNTSGFDYLRLILAVSVLAWHSAGIVYSRSFSFYLADSFLGHFILLILPAFFALSGFLVASSLMRSRKLTEFLGLRILRLIPALAVEICLSALILGPILTSLTLSAYFSDHQVFQYFLNIIGFIHFQLPGVFLDNPIPAIVNGSLWTIPFELECYIALAALWVLRLKGNGPAVIIALLLWCGLLGTRLILGKYEPIGPDALNGRLLVAYFLAGVCLYEFRHKIPADFRLFLIAFAVSLFMVKSRSTILFSPLFIAYCTVYIGLLRPKRIPYIFSGDYSYGIYLYAFPIQQAVYALIPQSHSWPAHFVLSLLGTSVLAVFSWHAIEKPLLKLKRHLRPQTQRIVAESAHAETMARPAHTGQPDAVTQAP